MSLTMGLAPCAEQPKRHDKLIQAFTGHRVDGLMIVPVGAPTSRPLDVLEREIKRGTAVVFIDRDPGFTAIFSAQNGLTLGAVRALQTLGMQHDIALVGFDHNDSADIANPGVTTVRQNAQDDGPRAGELLFNRLSGDQRPAIR
jgi:DNA-binding LacI/PurR family transcriptional regulator